MYVEAPEVHELARRVDFRLVRGLGLPQHRRGVHHRAVARGEEIGGLEEHGRPPLQGPRRPVAPRLARRRDRRLDLLGPRLVHLGQHVAVAMGHDGVHGLAGADLAAADDDGDLEDAGGRLLQGALQLIALRSSYGVREDGFVLGSWNHGRSLRGHTQGFSPENSSQTPSLEWSQDTSASNDFTRTCGWQPETTVRLASGNFSRV